MASISKFRDGWRAHLSIKGRRESKVFTTRYDASVWADRRTKAIRISMANDWVPPEAKILPLESLRELPEALPGCAYGGVYFLWNCDKLVYIGQSRRISHRVAEHRRKPPATWYRATHLRVPYPWCLAVEQLYITEYLPIQLIYLTDQPTRPIHGVRSGHEQEADG